MTTKLSSGRARFRRSTAALGIAGLTLAGLAGPALADNDENPPAEFNPPESTDLRVGGVDEPAYSDTEDNGSAEDRSETDESDQSGTSEESAAPSSNDAADEDAESSAESLNATTVQPFQDQDDAVTVDLVGLNDFHGRIDAGLTRDDDGTVTTEGAAVRLAAAVEEARENNPDTFFVGAGDLYSASTFTSMAGDDVPTTDIFNAIGMDTSAVGNHEFDHGFQNLRDRIEGNSDYTGHAITWEYLGANVYEEGTTNAVLPEYAMLDTDDVEIAVIGVVTEETPSLVTPSGIAGLDFGDPAEAVDHVIAANSDVQEADTIIVLTHDGGVDGTAVSDANTRFGAFAQAMAERNDIAGIFSGHTHTEYRVDLDGMPVIQTGSFGENLGRISLTFDINDEGEATLSEASSDMTDLSGVAPPAPGANDVVDEVREILDAAIEMAEEIGSETIGQAGADLLRATHIDDAGSKSENRGGESTISNLIADAQLWAVHDQGAATDLPVIAFMNPGGVRTDIGSGDVTYKEAADVQPFANTLETLDLTGAQLKQVLEEQWRPGQSRPFLKLGTNKEFFYTYDPQAAQGERITAMRLNGNPIDLDATYRVVTNNFLASGGDDFATLGDGAEYADTGLVDLTAFVNYFEDRGLVEPDYERRSIGVHWVSDEDGAYAEGDNVEIHLSSLIFSNGEPAPDSIAASLKNLRTGETIHLDDFDVDDTVAFANDESGTAEILFSVPSEDALGYYPADWELRLTGSNDLFELPLDIQFETSLTTVDLVGVNDFHGRIDAGMDTDDDGNVTTEGAAVRLAAAVEEARDFNSDTFFIGAGDLYSASTFTSMAGNDIPTTDVFNAMGMDTSAVGNHEFDRGFDDLLKRLAGDDEYDGHAILWDYLGANVYCEDPAVSELCDEPGDPALPEYIVLPTGDLEIAFIGLVTEETPSLVTPAGIEGLKFGDPTKAVERVIDEHSDVRDADTIVVLTHDGGVNGEAVSNIDTHFGAFAQAMADRGDIAGILSGHTHTEYQVDLDVPTTVSSIGTMPVIQTGSFGDNLGLISLVFDVDAAGNSTLVIAETDMRALDEVVPPARGENDVVDEVRDIVEAAIAEAEKVGSEIIGEAGADLLRASHTDPETGKPGENRGGESTISNLIADAQLWAVHEQAATDNLPVIAFMNPGGVRDDIEEGKVTYKEVADVQPFANTLETLDLTGAQIKQVLEEQWQPDGASRPFLKLGVNEEFFYLYDPEAPRDERITHMFLGGEPIELEKTYRVVTNNFLASGGDNFLTLGEGAAYADTGLVDLTAFVNYFEEHEVVNPDYAQRAIGVHWETGEDTEYRVGDDVEIHVSSLAFSNEGEPKPTTINATIWGEGDTPFDVGDFDIDSSVVNTNDEGGQAVLTFTVPDVDGLGEGVSAWPLTLIEDVGQFDIPLDILLTGSAADGGGGDDGGGAAPGDDMPDTGADVNGMLIATAILLAVGGTALAVRRRQTMS